MDYVNAPSAAAVRPSTRCSRWSRCRPPPAPAPESTTICVLDVLALKVKTGISHARLRPTLAVVDPDLTMTQPAMVTASCRDGHPVPRPRELDRAVVRRLRRQAARAAGDLLRRQPDRRHVVGEGTDPPGRRRSGRWSATARTRAAREQMALAATFAGSASATPASTSRTPAPTRSPAGCATTGRRATPTTSRSCRTGWPWSMTAPAAFALTFEASPERHLRAAELLGAAPRRRRPRHAAAVLRDLMRDVGLPSGLVRDRLRRRRTSTTWSRAPSSSSACSPPPPSTSPPTTWPTVFRSSLEHW